MRYLVAGAFSRSLAIVKFLSTYEGDANIVVYDGIDKCKWNGGRINRDIFHKDGLTQYYYSHDIGIALTFSNPVIDLTDETGNFLLEKFHKEGNAIILCNEELRKYIRENFPKYELIHSITAMGLLNIPLQDSDIEYYHQLEQDYDWIVPKFEHVFDKRADELDRSKWEVMVNDTCIWKCKYFDEHFKAIAHENVLGNPYSAEIEECWIPKFDPDVTSKYNCMDIDPEHIQKLKDVGVKSFKITGREMTDDEFIHELKVYLK